MAALRPPLPAPIDPAAPGLIRSLYPDCAFLTCAQVAKAINCGARHIADLCSEGSIQGAVSIAGSGNVRNRNFWRIPVACVEAWLKQLAAQAR